MPFIQNMTPAAPATPAALEESDNPYDHIHEVEIQADGSGHCKDIHGRYLMTLTREGVDQNNRNMFDRTRKSVGIDIATWIHHHNAYPR